MTIAVVQILVRKTELVRGSSLGELLRSRPGNGSRSVERPQFDDWSMEGPVVRLYSPGRGRLRTRHEAADAHWPTWLQGWSDCVRTELKGEVRQMTHRRCFSIWVHSRICSTEPSDSGCDGVTSHRTSKGTEPDMGANRPSCRLLKGSLRAGGRARAGEDHLDTEPSECLSKGNADEA